MPPVFFTQQLLCSSLRSQKNTIEYFQPSTLAKLHVHFAQTKIVILSEAKDLLFASCARGEQETDLANPLSRF